MTWEKVFFILFSLISIYMSFIGFVRIYKQISSGKGDLKLSYFKVNWKTALTNVLLLLKTFKIRKPISILHAFIAYGFLMFLFVNLGDLIYFFTGIHSFGIRSWIGDVYRAKTEIFNVLILVGILGMMIRRFIIQPPNLSPAAQNYLADMAAIGIKRDSLIVGSFIFLHTGARLVGEAFYIAQANDGLDPAQPVASFLANALLQIPTQSLNLGEKISFWLSLGSILLFLPYFPYSKHLHLVFAPINFLFKPQKRSIGEQPYIDIEDSSLETFGAEKVSDLPFEQILDGFACIMCYRCQEVCPPAQTGKILSPAVLEINKRYALNHRPADQIMISELLTAEAAWACTTCGACVDICPVGNEPMRDILEFRRYLTLNEGESPRSLEPAFRGMERNANPWNTPVRERAAWANGMNVPTLEENPNPDILWWVGCAPSTDLRAQKSSRAFAEILEMAGINFAILGNAEKCTGDSARRAGREDIFFELATENVATLNEAKFDRIVTTCPHCYHTIKNEYPAFGGNYKILHHTELINELIGNGSLKLKDDLNLGEITIHDPCYLSRHNQQTRQIREIVGSIDLDIIEMENNSENSFCCGAGGAQFWMEEQAGEKRINHARFEQAEKTNAAILAVACPFCMTMLTDAKKDAKSEIEILDISEITRKNIS
ncbi:MAG TPA: (Fe-S)-binding protein [Anaerolineales bacterium]|nr:(Fe-S)-binding protein [Anaerolineales bacterium]